MQKISWLICLFIFELLPAQKFSFEHISDKDGLINSHVTSIQKDQQGFMWFGTFNGLSRFDGYNFHSYINQPNDSTSIAGNQIRQIYETKEGQLIIAFQYNGFCVYNKSRDDFKRYSNKKNSANSLNHDYVLNVFQDKAGRIWIGTRIGLDLFDIKTGKFTHFYPFKNRDKPFICSMTEDPNGNLWLYGIGNELCIFNPNQKSFQYKEIPYPKAKSETFNKGGIVKFTREGKLWISNGSDGILIINTVNWTYEKLSAENNKIKSNNIICIKETADGTVWIGSDGEGIATYKNGNISYIQHNEDDPTSLASNAVYAIEQFNDNTIWVGTYAAGVSMWNKSKLKFNGFTIKGEPGKKLNNKSVLCIAEDEKNNVWLGTDGGGLNYFDFNKNEISFFSTANSKICFDVVKSISIDKNKKLWLGSYGKGICKWDMENNSTQQFLPDNRFPEKNIAGDKVWALLNSADGTNLYIGFLCNGFDAMNHTNGNISHNSIDETLHKKLAASNVFALCEDSKNQIWLSTETNGAVCFDPKNKTYTHFTKASSFHHSLPSDEIRDVFEDSHGKIWFATVYGGLCEMLDRKTQKFQNYSKNQGLNTTNVYCILEDANGLLWLSTDKGISSFDPKKKTFVNYTSEDGLVSNEFNYNSKAKTKNGYLYFGGIDGFNFFHPDSITFNTKVPQVVITNLSIFNNPINPKSLLNEREILNKAINLCDTIELFYSENIVSFEFSALEYLAPQKNKYAYKLQGFDENWREVSADRRIATYTNLSPGTYQFLVKAANSDGLWSKNPKVLTLIILPPWYMTWWFKTLLAVTILVGSIGYFYLKTIQIKKQNIFLQQEVKNRTKVIEEQQLMKDKFYEIVAHDLKNPITSMSLLSELINEEFKDSTNDRHRSLTRNLELSSTRLKNLVLNLLDWTRTQTSNIKINKEKINLNEIINDITQVVQLQASLKNIEIKLAINTTHFINCDREMISAAIRNILSNAIKFTNQFGEIRIESVLKNNEYITLSITDNGVGMEPETIVKLLKKQSFFSSVGTEKETGTGLGFMIAKEFIAINGGNLEIESKLGFGSTFNLHIPGNVEYVMSENLMEDVKKENIKKEIAVEVQEEFFNKQILIIEDDPQVRNMLNDLLSDYFSVRLSGNANEAYEFITKEHPDIILSDINMPGENGISFCQRIKSDKNTGYIPFILMTAQTSEMAQQKGLEAGADAYIHKPFNKQALLNTINNLLRTVENVKNRFSNSSSSKSKDDHPDQSNQDFINHLSKFVEKNIDNTHLNGDLMATEMKMSKSSLYVKIKNASGMTINDFIKIIRLKKSSQLLLEDNLNITQISYFVGFSDSSYFTKVFSKYYGVSPKEYIQKHSKLQL
ncbi:MAG: response regulator [Bacteroidetes bacterium]|nr:response regulator [Bacteroidota bacterium]